MPCIPGQAVEIPGSNVACETLTVRECLTVNGVDITGGGGGGGGWTDDGAVVRLTTAADQVSIGDPAPVGVSPLSVYEAASKWFAAGAVDAFGRRGLWFTMTDGILRLGANTSDGDAFDAKSEGAVVWDPAGNKAARIKADRFGLTRALDSSLYYFRVDGSSLFYRADPPGGAVWFSVDRATGATVIAGAPVGAVTIAKATVQPPGTLLDSGAEQTVISCPIPAGGLLPGDCIEWDLNYKRNATTAFTNPQWLVRAFRADTTSEIIGQISVGEQESDTNPGCISGNATMGPDDGGGTNYTAGYMGTFKGGGLNLGEYLDTSGLIAAADIVSVSVTLTVGTVGVGYTFGTGYLQVSRPT